MKPGELFTGASIQLPSKYEGLSPMEMTLQSLRDGNVKEWFGFSTRGRREGEEKVFVMTRYDLIDNTMVNAKIPYHLRGYIDQEDIKGKLRELAASREGLTNQ